MAKVRTRIQSQSELEARRYHKEVRDFKEWCKEHNIYYLTYEEASDKDICVLSTLEYELHDTKSLISDENESYFLTPKDYETWCDEEG